LRGEGAIEQGGKSYNCPQCNSGALEERGTVDEERLLDKPTPTLKDLAKKHDMPLADMGIQLAKGIKIEKEHTSDMLVAKEIALDHLNELPDYYDRLEKMEEAKPASNAKNYVRHGGNNEQYKWKVTLNNGKSKTVWADSRKRVKDSLGTSELIIGIKSAKKIAETSGAGGTGAGAVGGGASVGVGAAGDIGTWDGKKQKKQKGNTKDTGKGVYEGDDESWQDELRNKLDNMEKPDYSWAKKELYHVTRTEYVPGIQKNGLRPMGAPSNWVQQGNMERYGMGEVYVFTNKEDAKKWAGRMDWEFNQTIGSGNISIVTLNRPADHEFEKDESDPMSQAGAKGDWLKTYEPISPEYITGAQEFKSMKESDEEIIDFTDETCMECGQGTYVETSIFDDMDGVLHCSDCNHKVERYMPRNFVGKLLGEADNPYASAPSQGSSVDALAQQTKTAQPAKQAGDEEENNLQQRKDVDDLMVGDDIEVIDIDGDPTPVTVKTPRGPGDTVVVQTDKGEEHIVKKQAVSGTPTIEEMYEAALEEDNAYESALTDRVHEAYNANKTEHSGAKKGKGGYHGRKKDAKRDSNKKRRSNDKEAMKENWIEDMEAEDAETASFNEKEWSNLGFKQSSTWPTGVTLISMGDLRKNARAKFKQERWKRTEPEGGLSWFIHPEGKYMSVIEFQHGATTVTSMPVPSYMMGESFDPATHVSVEHRDPESRFIIVHAPPAGYWAVGQGAYAKQVDATGFDNFDDALEHAELCLSSMDESIDINEIRRLAGRVRSTDHHYPGGVNPFKAKPTGVEIKNKHEWVQYAKNHGYTIEKEADELGWAYKALDDRGKVVGWWYKIIGDRVGYFKESVNETASSGATGAGAIASAPTAMNGGDPVRRSIYDKPTPKKRKKAKESNDGSIGRAKK